MSANMVTLKDAKEDVDKVCIEVQITSDNVGEKSTRGFSLQHKTFTHTCAHTCASYVCIIRVHKGASHPYPYVCIIVPPPHLTACHSRNSLTASSSQFMFKGQSFRLKEFLPKC